MGRPLNKKYFQGGDGYTIGCNYHDGVGVVESVIVRQRSNTTYEVLGSAGTAVTGDWTTVTFADANPDTITRDDGTTDLSTLISAGDFIRIESATVTANDGVYEVATVTTDTITLTGDAELTASATDGAATIELITADSVVRAKLVDGAPTAEGEMQVVVTPETGTPATTSARIINAHTVKCFNGVTYAWNPTAAGNFRGMDGDAGPRFEEATLQAASS